MGSTSFRHRASNPGCWCPNQLDYSAFCLTHRQIRTRATTWSLQAGHPSSKAPMAPGPARRPSSKRRKAQQGTQVASSSARPSVASSNSVARPRRAQAAPAAPGPAPSSSSTQRRKAQLTPKHQAAPAQQGTQVASSISAFRTQVASSTQRRKARHPSCNRNQQQNAQHCTQVASSTGSTKPSEAHK